MDTPTPKVRRFHYRPNFREHFGIPEDAMTVAPNRATDKIDRGVCAESTCTECGCKGLRYLPFTTYWSSFEKRHDSWASYRAFAQCPTCGHASEF